MALFTINLRKVIITAAARRPLRVPPSTRYTHSKRAAVFERRFNVNGFSYIQARLGAVARLLIRRNAFRIVRQLREN